MKLKAKTLIWREQKNERSEYIEWRTMRGRCNFLFVAPIEAKGINIASSAVENSTQMEFDK